jgi:hypothetical protein
MDRFRSRAEEMAATAELYRRHYGGELCRRIFECYVRARDWHATKALGRLRPGARAISSLCAQAG